MSCAREETLAMVETLMEEKAAVTEVVAAGDDGGQSKFGGDGGSHHGGPGSCIREGYCGGGPEYGNQGNRNAGGSRGYNGYNEGGHFPSGSYGSGDTIMIWKL